MHSNNIIDYLRGLLQQKSDGTTEKSDYKQLFKNSLTERILSKILLEYNTGGGSGLELEDIILLLKDSKSTGEIEYLKEVLKHNFDIKNNNSHRF